MQEAGWSADPTGRHQMRYHDGEKWTEHVSDNGSTGVDPMSAEAPMTPPDPAQTPMSPMAAPAAASQSPVVESDKKPIWKRWWFIGAAGLVILAIIAAAVSPSDDDDEVATDDSTVAVETTVEADDEGSDPTGPEPEPTIPAEEPAATTVPVTEAPATSAAPTTTPPTTPPTTAAPTTTMPEGGTADAPLPIGDPARSVFQYEGFGDAWNGYIGGIVETGIGQFNDEAGRCLVVVGTLTATEVSGGTSNPFDTPSLTMLVDGRAVDSEIGNCDTDPIEAAGYDWILDARVTQGTTFAFYDEFFLSADATPSSLLVGDQFGDDVLFFEPTISTEIPPVGELSIGVADRELLPIGDPARGFTYTEFGDDEWEGYIGALVEAPVGQFTDEPGRCVVAVGVITPAKVDGVTSNPFTAPSIDLIAGGRVVELEFGGCDTSAIEAAGYDWILDAEVVEGTPYPFYDEFFLPEGTAELESIVVGSSVSDDALYYEPTITAEIPAPVIE